MRSFKLVLMTLCALGVLAAAWGVSCLRKADPVDLFVCMTTMKQPAAWSCKTGLLAFHPTPEEVQVLNRRAFALPVSEMPVREEARELLGHLVRHGLDLNAAYSFGDRQSRGWTALHSAALAGNVASICLLLEAGATPSVRGVHGETPLDVARHQQAHLHGRAGNEAVTRILESAEAGRLSGCLSQSQ